MNSFIHATQKKKRTDNFCLWVGESNQVKVNIKEAGLLAMSGSYFQIIGFGIQIVIFWKTKEPTTRITSSLLVLSQTAQVHGGFWNTQIWQFFDYDLFSKNWNQQLFKIQRTTQHCSKPISWCIDNLSQTPSKTLVNLIKPSTQQKQKAKWRQQERKDPSLSQKPTISKGFTKGAKNVLKNGREGKLENVISLELWVSVIWKKSNNYEPVVFMKVLGIKVNTPPNPPTNTSPNQCQLVIEKTPSYQ